MVDDVLADAKQHMESTIGSVTHDLNALRTGRASISILDDVQVDYYGTMTPLNQLASLTAPDPNLLVVQPYDKSAIENVEKAILQAELGRNPGNDGTVIRIPIPELTEERRVELTKIANKYVEQARVAARNVRRDGMETLKRMEKDGEISQDDQRRWSEDIQKLTDETVKTIDETLSAKDQEIMQV